MELANVASSRDEDIMVGQKKKLHGSRALGKVRNYMKKLHIVTKVWLCKLHLKGECA